MHICICKLPYLPTQYSIVTSDILMAGGVSEILRCNRLSTSNSTHDFNGMIISHPQSLMDGLNALRCADKLFDVTLIAEGQRFKAHRVVLAACSDYFSAMFCDPMLEARQSEIHLHGVCARGIQMLIEYAYTSRLDLDYSNVQDVLAASTYVQMNAVIKACSRFLETKIDMENCVAIAGLSELYSLTPLRRKTYRYICSRLDDFAKLPDLYNLTHEQMEFILSCNYPVDCDEQHVLRISLKYCLETKLDIQYARCLLAHINYHEIKQTALNSLLKCQQDQENKSTTGAATAAAKEIESDPLKTKNNEKLQLPAVYRDALNAAWQEDKESKLSKGKNTTASKMMCPDLLRNARGMELALVKIGGFETNGLTNKISCFLPSRGKWENLTVIPHIDQCNYGTAVLGNDLYVVGGSYDVLLKEYIHPFGFRYCPTRDKWNTIAPIQTDRCRFSLNAMANRYLYAVGGCFEHEIDDNLVNGELPSNCECYDAVEDRWRYMPALSENRFQHAGVVVGDQLYISGGIRHIVLASLWRFDTKTDTWQKMAPMPTPRADHVLISIDNYIYACGGWYEHPEEETRELVETIDVYDIHNDQWNTETCNPQPKYYTGVAALERKIYFIGGLLSDATINRGSSSTLCYDLDTKVWSFNTDFVYPNEVWECFCLALYVPRERDQFVFIKDD